MRPCVRAEEHVGEWKIVLWADTLEEIFREAARVVSRTAGRPCGAPGSWERVALSAGDPAALLVDWLNELLGRHLN